MDPIFVLGGATAPTAGGRYHTGKCAPISGGGFAPVSGAHIFH